MIRKLLPLLIIFVLLLSLPCGCFSGAEKISVTDGIGFNADELYNKFGDDIYSSVCSLSDIPHTFEAWICVPEEQSGVGVVYGNYDNHTSYFLNIAVADGNPRIYWRDNMKNLYDIYFDEVDLRTGEYTHLTIVNDSEQGRALCYVDGELIQQKSCPDFTADIIKPYFAVGGDQRRLNSSYFKGRIKSVNVFSDARSGRQIKKDMRGVKPSDTLLAGYGFSEENKGKTVTDNSKNGVDLLYSNLWLTRQEAEEANVISAERGFTIAVVGDTQYMSRYNPDKLPVLYKWLADNAETENIKYAIGLGDITDRDIREEWDAAKSAISQLDGVLEYSLIRGNHDVKEGGDIFNEYFANDSDYTEQFEKYGGFYEQGSVANTWRVLSAGKTEFLLINLDYSPSAEVLEWAGGVIEEHPDSKVIISTHAYLYSDGTHLSIGKKVWQSLASVYDNVELVLCGHISCNEVRKTQLIGKNGNTVTELLIDAQDYDKYLDGLGMVALLRFSEDGQSFGVQYYSTVLDRYYRHSNCFSVDLEAEGTVCTDEVWDGGKVKPLGDGTKESPYLISEASNLLWMADSVTATTEKGSFKGVYFKQTQDIDLDGKALRSIGYYYYSSDTEMYAFGGVYDGNGYKIKNGILYGNDPDTDYQFNKECGYGLFGVIYGATVKNITLENITVVGSGVTGAIAGKAAGQSTGGSDSSFNRIENCTVSDSCKTVPFLPRTMTAPENADFDSSGYAGILGGIVGQARSCSVTGCSFEGKLLTDTTTSAVGGIAGSAGYNSEITDCSFDGSIAKTEQQIYKGAVVGIESPTELTLDVGDNCEGTLTVQGCQYPYDYNEIGKK